MRSPQPPFIERGSKTQFGYSPLLKGAATAGDLAAAEKKNGVGLRFEGVTSPPAAPLLAKERFMHILLIRCS